MRADDRIAREDSLCGVFSGGVVSRYPCGRVGPIRPPPRLARVDSQRVPPDRGGIDGATCLVA